MNTELVKRLDELYGKGESLDGESSICVEPLKIPNDFLEAVKKFEAKH